jgi:hypothetical protein
MTSFSQRKLSKTEWESIEVPSTEEEKRVLRMICKGYHDLNIKENDLKTLFSYLKIAPTDKLHQYLFNKYFKAALDGFIARSSVPIPFYEDSTLFTVSSSKHKSKSAEVGVDFQLKKADHIRLKTAEDLHNIDRVVSYETLLLNIVSEWFAHHENARGLRNRSIRNRVAAQIGVGALSDSEGTLAAAWNAWRIKAKLGTLEDKQRTAINDSRCGEAQRFYALHKLSGLHVTAVNTFVQAFVKRFLTVYMPADFEFMVLNAASVIEENKHIFKHQDRELYGHQKQLFHAVKNPGAKLITYIAPTGTGKTLSPLGISEAYRVIFICAARHVALALAKASVSLEKKIAVAFGCRDAGDVKLHYYAVSECTRNTRTGKIRKVDNSVGDKVEIMICDIQSYIPAMRYMLAFNEPENVVLFWDEPTITMDYENHELHDIIRTNWKDNVIPNVVLSSATLPRASEMKPVVDGFTDKFPDAGTSEIASYDCKKTIQLLDATQQIELPHYLCDTWEKVRVCVQHLLCNKTVLRYLDVRAIMSFVKYLISIDHVPPRLMPRIHFESIGDITMTGVKLYYLEVLEYLDGSRWDEIYRHEISNRVKPFNDSIHITSQDAWTLTDGPTIYLTNDVNRVAQFCLKKAGVPKQMVDDMQAALQFNSKIAKQIAQLEKDIDDKDAEDSERDDKDDAKGKKIVSVRAKTEVRQLREKVDILRGQIKPLVLNDVCVPNTRAHLERFDKSEYVGRSFSASIDSAVAERILSLSIADNWKILLMMGIGVFATGGDVSYIEIMKKLATDQRLYLILADSDYIYGTNYQFSHAYLGKDTKDMTQDKTVQAMGRVGRGRLQQSYSVRLRDNTFATKIFMPSSERPELHNMNTLLSGQ